MTVSFCKETDGIYRLKVPFEDIYTSVFLVISENYAVLIDCATTADDVDKVIAPALEKLGYDLKKLKALVLTHRHCDHAGGLTRILELYPSIEVITDAREIFEGVYTYPLPGHTLDSVGVLDTRTGTLISGDGLQGAGVGKYRCYTQSEEAYIETLNKIENDKRIKNILFSHAYEPWNEDNIIGRERVLHCLDFCQKYINERK